jgi:hypothetical protein
MVEFSELLLVGCGAVIILRFTHDDKPDQPANAPAE